MKHKVLFVHNGRTKFVETDFHILSKHYVVTEYYLRSRRMNLWQAFSLVRSHDFVFGWFASWHTFFPFVIANNLHIPSLIVAGGYDVANMPEIGYGHQRGWVRKWVSRIILDKSACIVTFSMFSRNEILNNVGIKHTNIHVIPLGVHDEFGDHDEFEILPKKMNRCALTVGNVDQINLWRKGHEPFVRAATYLPDFQFMLVGRWRDKAIEHLRSIAPSNVTFTGWVSDEVLRDYYLYSSVYVQASLHEGFGMSVAEAMLAGCIPVVTHAGALPEVVGDAGVYVDSQEPSLLADSIRHAYHLGQNDTFRNRARTRILELFPLEKREQELCSLIDALLEQRR